MELILWPPQQPPHQVDVGGLVHGGDNHVENYYQKHFFRIDSNHRNCSESGDAPPGPAAL